MPIRYTRVGWQDAPSTETPIDAANLNHMDNGILALSEAYDADVPKLQQDVQGLLDEIDSVIDERITGRIDELVTASVNEKTAAINTAINKANGDISDINTRFSHVGMIIHTTTLKTMEDVIAIYGGTTWIRHAGYMLRAATTGVVPNSSSSDGGKERVTLSANESGVRSHGHVITTKRTNITEASGGNTMVLCHSSNGGTTVSEADGAGYIGHTSKAASASHENMPPYKNVYIWERTE